MPKTHRFRCDDFDETDNEATLTNLDYLEQGRLPLVIAFCDEKLSVGQVYKGHITGTNPSELRFVLSDPT